MQDILGGYWPVDIIDIKSRVVDIAGCLDELSALVSTWNKVEDGLPDTLRVVRVYIPELFGNKEAHAQWDGDKWTYCGGLMRVRGVTHWLEITPPEVD
jgi:hypothetical protein